MIEDKFNAAVNVIRSLPKDGPYQPSHDMMLKFYGLYKQATQGPCKEAKPSFYEVVKRYKWKAWISLGNMSRTDAMNNYVEELKKVAKPFENMPSHIVETMAYSENVAAFFEALGPFYEYVELSNIKNSDSNHNITGKCPERGSPNNFELISLCNGEGSPSMNGIQSSDDSDPNEDSGTKSKLLVGPKFVNGFESNDRKNPSPEHNKLTNGESIVVDDGIYALSHSTLSLSPDDQISEPQTNSPADECSVSSLKKLASDTDSDEEYSEPAETPELLQQKQRLKVDERNGPVRNEVSWESLNLNTVQDLNGSPVLQILTCGGGDAADAGRIRLTQTYQLGEGSRDGRGYSDPSLGQASTSFRGGASGGRRRRDSDDPRPGDRGSSSMNVNTQLIRILQKIHLDLEAVLVRLETLESQTLHQHQQTCRLCQRRLGTPFPSSEKTSWWPFPELSPRSTFFLLTWPLILHGAIKLLIFLRSQRRKTH